jgi:dTDP-4-amino-4,6-dideoxygalactose transaminase
MKFLDVYSQDKPILNKIYKDIKKIISNSDFILGQKTFEFEQEFAKYCNSKFAVGCGNGTDALYIAIKALNLPQNSEVILPSMTWCSTLFAIIQAGLKPILVDIDKDSPTISIEAIKNKITKNTKLIILVHLYGESCKYSELKKIIKYKNIKIIEDAAQAHGSFDVSSKKKYKVGSMGDIACFSFYPGKNLGAYGDAGALVTNNQKFYKYMIKFRNMGSKVKHNHEIVGINSRLDTIQASILLNKLKYLDIFNKKRMEIAEIYNQLINNKNIIKLNYSSSCVYHQYVVVSSKANKFRKYLKLNKIPFMRHYPKPLHKLKVVKNLFKGQRYKNSERLARYGTSLPINPLLKKKDILKICKVINNFT